MKSGKNEPVKLKKRLPKIPRKLEPLLRADIERELNEIKKRRIQKKITQELLVELMEEVVSIDHIRSIESGRSLPSLQVLFLMKRVIKSY